MSNTTINKSNLKRTKTNRRVIISVWLIMALLTSAAALALWMFSAAPTLSNSNNIDGKTSSETASNNIARVTKIDELNELENSVQPISFDALIRDFRDYPSEFKDSKYLTKNKRKWTVQIMDVSEHDIIMDYLNSRSDREKFAYFRYRDENNQPRYILTYDVIATPQLARGVANSMDFGLPTNVRVTPEELSNYLDIIEKYELSGPIKDLSANRARDIRLRPAKREIQPRYRSEQSTSNTSQNQTPDWQLQPKPTDIKESSDTSDTLSVQEGRKIVIDGEVVQDTTITNQKHNSNSKSDDNEQGWVSQGQNINQNQANQSTSNIDSTPSKPINQQTNRQSSQQKPNEPQNKETNQPDANQQTDSIKQLIEEQSQ